MLASLDRLAALPDSTLVCCTHEYTLANLRFARALEPEHPGLADHQRWCERQRQAGRPTLPSRIGLERALNPFLRSREPALRHALQRLAPEFALAGFDADADADAAPATPEALQTAMAAKPVLESAARWTADVRAFAALRRCKDVFV